MSCALETDITIEVFNRCAGTCTGCLLSVEERQSPRPAMTVMEFERVLDALLLHGSQSGLRYRPVLSFGDFPSLEPGQQDGYLTALNSRGMSLGVTMTLVDEDAERYRAAYDRLVAADPRATFDITVDPVRLDRQPSYVERVREACAAAPHLHLQVLLSDAVMRLWTPEKLSALLTDRIGPRAVSLGFTPTMENLGRSNFRYPVNSAAAYATRFYEATLHGRAHLAAEFERYHADGRFADFISQSFHVGAGCKVYPVAYTIFGDVIMDARNSGSALGVIGDPQSLGRILSGSEAQRLTIHNAIWMEKGSFGCAECEHRPACEFNGVGAARRLYRDHENRAGSCYGPLALKDSLITQSIC